MRFRLRGSPRSAMIFHCHAHHHAIVQHQLRLIGTLPPPSPHTTTCRRFCPRTGAGRNTQTAPPNCFIPRSSTESDGWRNGPGITSRSRPVWPHSTDRTRSGGALPPTSESASPTSSSKYRAPRKESPAIEGARIFEGIPSMSRSCSRESNILGQPRPICAGSSGASRRGPQPPSCFGRLAAARSR